MVPNHHTKVNVCPNRPSYREGRKWKAVKVYTVNLEAKYLLVQGVPALGTCQELVKLFSTYGSVEEYRVLDDFPAEQFTEVYLIKYKNIYSARRAKRRLDDYSFFGGVLHVSYAAEYETVEETREKLIERRKAIASQCRKLHSIEEHSDLQKRNSALSGEDGVHSMQPVDVINKKQDQNPSPPDKSSVIQVKDVCEGSDKSDHFSQGHCSSNIQTLNSQNVYQAEAQYWLPPPPQNLPLFLQRPPPPLHSRWEYAKVPSAHATLPANFENTRERQIAVSQISDLGEGKCFVQSEYCGVQNQSLTSKAQFSDKHSSHPEGTDSQTISSVVRYHDSFGPDSISDISGNSFNKSNNGDVLEKTELKSLLKPDEKMIGGLLVKKIDKSGPSPRFIPRQINRQVPKCECASTVPEEKKKHSELKQNAFILGGVHGPEKQKTSLEGIDAINTEKSVKTSVLEIRKRVRQFTEEKVVKKTKKMEDP